MRFNTLLSIALCLFASSGAAAEKLEAEVCVYGGTSGGVAAAVQAARMGKRTILLEPGRHLGGMTSGGLSAVDIGDPRSVGGVAREYFTRLAATVGRKLAWDEPFKHGSGGPATGGAYAIEPHKAERVFADMAREAGVKVRFNARLAEARKVGTALRELVMEDGTSVRAQVFIDTTYEGDLMAAAGVSYTLQREGNARYGESYNGIQYSDRFMPRTRFDQPRANGRLPSGQGAWDRDFPLDPYVLKGDPGSGLLPLVNAGEPGVVGEPAPGVQAYCFRLCLTTDKENMIPIAPPPDYDAKRYELVARFIAACEANGDDMDLRWFSKHDALPNRKWDFNTATFGGNLPGHSWAWPEASYTEREDLMKELEDYHRGLFHFLRTDPRVPAKVTADVARFGLPKDEFTDRGGWPHQVYIREGRRMVSDFVMTEHHTFGREIAPRGIGLGSYGTDAHEIRRIVKDGVVTREGKLAMGRGGFGPYRIDYGAIVPRASECANLLVTFALSASHSAFASIRMEPVFMVTSQSAATAACQAIDANVPVQKVDYAKLRERLTTDGQVLEWTHARKQRPVVKLSGIVLDDEAAEFKGNWVNSTRVPGLVGRGYQHDNNRDKGLKSALFTLDLPQAGAYEVRFLYTPNPNRAASVPITVRSQDGEKTVRVNQREELLENGVPRALGVFNFAAGKSGSVTVSNANTSGYVTVDGLQLVPAAEAKAERAAAGKRAKKPAASSPVKPIPFFPGAKAGEVDGRKFDLVVVGGTPGGIACAVRAARERLAVLLVNHTLHLGGFMTSGAGGWEAPYDGLRSPLYAEIRRGATDRYRKTYGEGSQQHLASLPDPKTNRHIDRAKIEPRIAELLFDRMVVGEKTLTVLKGFYVTAAERDGALLKSVTLRELKGDQVCRVSGKVFADGSYEGDLAAVAKVPYRVGREARAEYDEPHAGVIYTRSRHLKPGQRGFPLDADQGRLNIRYNSHATAEVVAGPDSGAAHPAVMAFNYRLILTKDPANRVPVPQPADTDATGFPKTLSRSIVPGLPNAKIAWNGGGRLVGPQLGYPEGGWEERECISRKYLDAALKQLWLVQHGPGVPAKEREFWRDYGLAADEFPDNDHLPYEVYVREARRIVGRHVFTEHDGVPAAGLGRTPIQTDSVAITDWPIDSVACTPRRVKGSNEEGIFFLAEEARPAQVPFRSLLPRGVDNLLVPVALSASHVGWGCIRLEPEWMQTGEAAGFAAALAVRQKTTPARLDADLLIRRLVRLRHMVSFFNDVDVAGAADWIPAVQYFGTKGFFADYDARPTEPLTGDTARLWAQGFNELRSGSLDPNRLAKRVALIEEAASAPVTGREFAALFPLVEQPASFPVSRALVAKRLFDQLR